MSSSLESSYTSQIDNLEYNELKSMLLKLESENLEQARLLGISANKELVLRAKLTETEAELARVINKAKITIPTHVMEQSFALHFDRGYARAKAELTTVNNQLIDLIKELLCFLLKIKCIDKVETGCNNDTTVETLVDKCEAFITKYKRV